MANSFERGLSGSQVSQWAQNDTNTPSGFTSLITPYGLKLQQIITSSGSVTIPANITFVYAICVGGGGAGIGGEGRTGGGGAVAWGWTLAFNSCIVGAGGVAGGSLGGGYTQYGNIIAGGGGAGGGGGALGGGCGAINFLGNQISTANYWGMPSGVSSINGFPGAGGGGGLAITTN
jgi:hypothetical protein